MKLHPVTLGKSLQFLFGPIFSILAAPTFLFLVLFMTALERPADRVSPMLFFWLSISVLVFVSIVPLWLLTLFGTEKIGQRTALKWFSILTAIPALFAYGVMLVTFLAGLIFTEYHQLPRLGQIIFVFLSLGLVGLMFIWVNFLSSLLRGAK